jgi:hypothetical protein
MVINADIQKKIIQVDAQNLIQIKLRKQTEISESFLRPIRFQF